MQIVSKTDFQDDELERLVKRIPFFNEVFTYSEQQFDALVALAESVSVEPGETVIHKGDTDSYLYFLLRGQLAVFLDEDPYSSSVNYISPGEVFGILSMITNTPRSAMIKADENAKATLLLRLDFAHFATDKSSSTVDLQAKLMFYRMAVHNVRWTLEMNKMQNPQHPLVQVMMKLPFVNAPKDTQEELDALKEQAQALSELLFLWNEYDGGSEEARAKVMNMNS